jgi:hypothetical protein
MGRIVEMRVVFAGYRMRFRIRKIKTRRRKNGKARGFYEGEYVYLEIKDPSGAVRDKYLGVPVDGGRPIDPAEFEGVEYAALGALQDSRSRRVEKTGKFDKEGMRSFLQSEIENDTPYNGRSSKRKRG